MSIVFYPGSITKITDPFWRVICECGYESHSVTEQLLPCPKCQSLNRQRFLGSKTYEDVAKERPERLEEISKKV